MKVILDDKQGGWTKFEKGTSLSRLSIWPSGSEDDKNVSAIRGHGSHLG